MTPWGDLTLVDPEELKRQDRKREDRLVLFCLLLSFVLSIVILVGIAS